MYLRYKAACNIIAPAGMPTADIKHKIMSAVFDHPRFKVRAIEGWTIDDEQPSGTEDDGQGYSATATIDIPGDIPWADVRRGVGEMFDKVEDPLLVDVVRIDERPDDVDRIIAAHELHAPDPLIEKSDEIALGIRQTISFWWRKMAPGQTEVPVTAGGVFLTKFHGAVPVPAPGDKVSLYCTHVRVIDRHISYTHFIDQDGVRLTEVEVNVYVDVLPPSSGVQGDA